MNLGEKEEKILELLSESGLIEDFYLAGGTALALRHRHRISKDLDFFTQNVKISLIDLEYKLSSFFQKQRFEPCIEFSTEDTLILKVEDIQCSFFHYPYRLLEDPEKIAKGIKVARDKDIGCMKAIAISQRGSKKDFFDLYFLMNKHKWGISEIINFCKAKYGNIFPEKVFLKALIYFKDAEKEYYPEIESTWKKIKKFLIKNVNSYLHEKSSLQNSVNLK